MPIKSEVKRYSGRRSPKVPPHVSIAIVRRISGYTLDDVCGLIAGITGDRPTKGALSAIENGHRGASRHLIRALEQAYNLPVGAITTTYTPRDTPGNSTVEVA